MRVALSVDMEGISQLDDWRAVVAFDPAYWREGRAQMEADVAAAARGLLGGGADEVVVLDNHASGNPINVRPESLPAGARLETWHPFDLRERGVEALIQVGYHSRAELDAFWPHTFAPELVLHVDGEPISESHGRAWAADIPLLGICGNDVHGRTLGSLDGVPYLVTQTTSSTVDARPAASLDEIESFAEEVVRAGGVPVKPPQHARFEAFVRREPFAALDISRWEDARQPIADAMAAAVAPWLPYFTTFDLTSEEAMAAVQDEPLVHEGRNVIEAWLARAGRGSAAP
jgi:D-aminopeptidase